MEPSYRIVPSKAPKTASVTDTANSFGLHDTLRYGTRTLAAELQSHNSLEGRLNNWEETQDNLQLTMQREIYGLHVPMRQLMERKLVSTNPHMPAFPQSNIHLDILMGRDETIDVADIFGGLESGPPMDIHAEIGEEAAHAVNQKDETVLYDVQIRCIHSRACTHSRQCPRCAA